MSFDSLQTGTRIARDLYHQVRNNHLWVSIPFKRERASQGLDIISNMGFVDRFQFPSNGNAHRKVSRLSAVGVYEQDGVSIPFKRERASQGLDKWTAQKQRGMFPFPSNRNAHRKHLLTRAIKKWFNHCFHSLQTGKGIASHISPARGSASRLDRFPFPSNGNAHRKPLRK